ncbi:DUF4006 family protein [Campylobacter insulaenigrae]|uniref:DUF4006 domain protein n=2 Tax=Campylobacter insulaenigrae TaxID=260714 RepID=A0A0A8H014_9BACT|nr:DUF4006 family protein [Campylobacter insulaenigrae]AJC87361.1 hypothetical protein (DUF4006 domain) [Campylobacter insulaenigrae NCTC 12927]MCR6570471.1 DUF4006 family protein [Campylobacter insulaenigrae]MCR6572111.1 DUF4006 family protein [Campylobacter insulaenigrae]MCR6573681.1 DUF4006 family protein [Campylobacter insulaenigrae]MCR6575510.1 DUF4006 family protein [Campylobacter insulaenigrae]
MENQNRCVFSLSGVSGMLVATILLLAILVGLTLWGLKTQQEVMQKPYKLENAEQIKMFNSKKEEHIIVKE